MIKDEHTSIRENGLFASDDFFNVFEVDAVVGDPSNTLLSALMKLELM